MHSLWNPPSLARLIAIAFVLPGVLGFVPNPIIGADSLFVTNTAHNLVHLVTAALFLGVSVLSAQTARRFTLGFGVVYLLVGVLGFIVLASRQEGMLLGVVHINQLDNFLHVGLGALILLAGLAVPLPTRERASA